MTGTSPSPIAAPSRRPARWKSASALLLLATAGAVRAEEVDRIVLRVNDQIATLLDYQERKATRLEFLASEPSIPEAERQRQRAVVGKSVMREIYDELLILSRGQQLRLEIRREQVDEAVANTRQRYGIDTDDQFAAALAQSGMNLDQYRKRLERNLMYQEVISREVQSKIKQTDEDLQRYYREHPEEFRSAERVQLKELVVLSAATPDEAARLKLAGEIREELQGGKVAEVAERYQKAGTTSQLNDLGWVHHGELDAALDAVAFAAPVGSVSEPVAGRGGLHLLLVVAHEPSKVRPYEEIKDELRQRQRGKLFEQEMQTYLADLDRKAFLVADPPAEAIGFRDFRDEEGRPGELTAPGGPAAVPSGTPPAAEGAAPPPAAAAPAPSSPPPPPPTQH